MVPTAPADGGSAREGAVFHRPLSGSETRKGPSGRKRESAARPVASHPRRPLPSPPLQLREKRPRALLLGVGRAGAAEAERGGGRTRCERSRSGPRCWCWGRWRASASEVSEAPGGGNAAPRWSASGILPQPRWQRWSGETRPAARLLTE